ncbi:histidine phosphatase family protein [Streptomyces sp. TS71-3]|uniref:SixA phosphatase family protein n=1 Tax=Streptomyces sp. TS71-3 TaxID=2733862 RepID=UPI001B2B3DDD|nr:histidine phosphatase family protein [Streptomyces sp. TS71-3]GHJ41184.1 phosphoglycerate mutase [Streptomyces sp. TS71-3]
MTVAPARLVVLRHAKSAWPDDVPDQERPLAQRGQRDAPAAGRWLRESGYEPDLVLCSTALRTRQTWDKAAEQLRGTPLVLFDPRIYAADVDRLLDVLREVFDQYRSVLLIGHHPGVQDLVLALSSGGDNEGLTRLRTKFPTSAIAVMTQPGRWADLAPGTALLTKFAVPRGPVPAGR